MSGLQTIAMLKQLPPILLSGFRRAAASKLQASLIRCSKVYKLYPIQYFNTIYSCKQMYNPYMALYGSLNLFMTL